MNKLIFHIALLSCFISVNLDAQIEAPEFLCVRSDTLFWELPVNSCGPFNAYNVYASDNMSGPFFLLSSINNSSQTSYYHDNPSNQIWYYYLQSDFNCPGEPILSSDILNNLPPEASPLLVVDVVNGKVQMQWEASPSPEVIGYIIYRVTDIGTIPIDTVYSGTSYIDLASNPGLNSENYYVIALDECGNTSLLESPHLTVFVDSEVSECEQTVRLSWNLYEGWNNGIERQELWLQVDGSTAVMETGFGPSDTLFIYENIDDGTDYCFHIRSYQNGSPIFSVSNLTCFTADIVQPMRNIALKNVSVDANNEVGLNWQWDINAEINEVQILRALQNGDYTSLDIFPPDNVLAFNNSYLDVMASASTGPVYYQIQTIDDCDSIARSNYAATIFLSGKADGGFNNQLSWTPFETSIGLVKAYELFKVDVSGVQSIAFMGADEFQYWDPVDPKIQSDANVCYFVVAEVVINLPGGGDAIIFSRSNTTCVEQLSEILAPNAFVPGGKNSEFKPLLVFGEQVDYSMMIWDRWGQKVFESNDINKGWTGRDGFFEFPGGAYTYFIKITQPGGRVVNNKGVVILIR